MHTGRQFYGESYKEKARSRCGAGLFWLFIKRDRPGLNAGFGGAGADTRFCPADGPAQHLIIISYFYAHIPLNTFYEEVFTYSLITNRYNNRFLSKRNN
jgi:hypothetical protein